MSSPRRRLRPSGDDGQLTLLVLAYTVIAALLVTVVVNVSRVYLERRSLLAAADGAALSAANAVDLGGVYAGAGGDLPLDAAGARTAVEQYVRDADLARQFGQFRVVGVDTDGVSVTVTFAATVPMPFANLLSARYDRGYPLRAAARARSPLTP